MTEAPTHVLVVDKAAGELVGLELATGAAAWRVNVGTGPHEVIVAPSGTVEGAGPLALVSVYGTMGAPGSEVMVVDLSTLTEVARLSTLPYTMPHGLALVPGTSRLLVTVEADDAVLALDLADPGYRAVFPTLSRLPHMVVAAPGGDAAYAANIVGGAVSRLPLHGGEPQVAAVGAGAEAVALSPQGELWVGSNEENEVHVLDPDDLTSLAVLPTCRVPIRVTPVGADRMAVTCYRDSEVQLFDAVTRERLGSVTLAPGSFPVGTLATHGGARLYVAATASGEVHELDVGSLSVVRTFDAGTEPDGMAAATLTR